jgi:diguanylate cyclase (GGDEF)-like protein
MHPRTVVVLDVPTEATPPGERRLLETLRGTAMHVEEVGSLATFTSALRSKRARVGVVAFEALWPDPQRTLRALRDNAPGARLLVAYSEHSHRVRLGQRLWSVGLCDYFIPRSSAPHELTPVLRQAYADALIEDSVDAASADDDPAMAHLYGRIRFLNHLNAALTNQRRVDGLVRELQMRLPRLMDYDVLEVLITGAQDPALHVFQSGPIEHQVVWQLADDLCNAVAPFTEQPLTPEVLRFIENAPKASADGERDAGTPPTSEHFSVTIPMVFCGELVGGIGVVAASEISNEHRAILQLVAYQLASSLRNAQAFEDAETASLVDELTGTYNRRYLKRALLAEWRRAERYRVELSFAMVDIDHFKRINDTYGHLVGDAVLHAFASLLRQQLRDTDHLVRYGGEEFLLILPETGLRDATLVVERIRLLLARTPLYTSERVGNIQVTISGGVAGVPTATAGSAEELIHLADEALLIAKSTGRDRVCLASAEGFDTLAAADERAGREKRRFSRIRSQLPVRFVELPEFEGRTFSMSATDVSAGGIAVQGPSQPLRKNAYALVYVGDEQKPRLSQVMWTRDGDEANRTAGLQFVGATELGTSPITPERRRALVVAQDPQTRAMIHRVMSAAQYDVRILDSPAAVQTESLEQYSLLVLGESSLRGELGERLQQLREQHRPQLRIALINEAHDRRAALDTIRAQHADHLLPSSSSEDTLFATLSKLLLQEYFGLKKYLLWGAETRSWMMHSSEEKPRVLDEVKEMALEVDCHPRIADLMVSAVDEMIINALYRAEPIDARSGRSRRPVTVECGSDGRFLGVAVLDEHGLFCHDDLFRGIGKALEHEEKGIAHDAANAHLGFRIMLSTLSHLVINVDPGRCTEIIGLVDLRKSLKEYRTAVPSLGMFTSEQRSK